jgi:hypothetical protein
MAHSLPYQILGNVIDFAASGLLFFTALFWKPYARLPTAIYSIGLDAQRAALW